MLLNLERQIAKFWTMKGIPASTPKSIEECDGEMHFLKHVIRNTDGRYLVRLPFRNDGR